MDKQYIIIDNGSGFCKAGFSGEGEPKVIIPSVVGHPKISGIESSEDSNLIFGQNALDNKATYNLVRPVKNGIITDWNDIRLFWDYIFKKELKIDPSTHGVFITETPLTPKFNREKLTETLFEYFKVPSIFITNGAVLGLYGAGKFSGIVCDSGYDLTDIVPISDGYPFSSTINQLNLGGKDITDYFLTLLEKNNKGVNIRDQIKNPDQLKEQYCYLSQDRKNGNSPEEITYTLPDKNTIKIKDERYLCTELFFHPEYVGKELGGIARILCESIYKADRYIKKEIEGNIVVTGGNTLFPGFETRFNHELQNFANGLYKSRIKIIAIPERKHVQWIGASIFSLMSIFPGLCTKKEEYNEYGASIVHNKCFY